MILCIYLNAMRGGSFTLNDDDDDVGMCVVAFYKFNSLLSKQLRLLCVHSFKDWMKSIRIYFENIFNGIVLCSNGKEFISIIFNNFNSIFSRMICLWCTTVFITSYYVVSHDKSKKVFLWLIIRHWNKTDRGPSH